MGKKQGQSRVQSPAGVRPQTKRVSPPLSMTAMIGMSLLLLYSGYLTVSAFQRNGIFHTPVTLWKSAVQSAPDKRRTHENYGQALSTAGLLQEALQQFKTVLALPDDGSVPLRDVYREIGVVYFRLGLIDESITSWKKGLEHAGGDAGLLNNISIALMRQKRFDEALSHAEMAVRSNPYMPEPLNTLGEIHLTQGNAGKSIEYFKKYLYLRPEDARGYWNIAIALEREANYDESYRYVNKFLSLSRDQRFNQEAQAFLKSLQGRMNSRKN